MKTYTTDHLRVLDPQGQHILSVMPIPAGEIVAQHIANLLTQSDATNTTTMLFGDDENEVVGVLTGEFAGEMAERIAALMKMAIGTPTSQPSQMCHLARERMDNSFIPAP